MSERRQHEGFSLIAPLEIKMSRTPIIQQITPTVHTSTSERSAHKSIRKWANHGRQGHGLGERNKGAVILSQSSLQNEGEGRITQWFLDSLKLSTILPEWSAYSTQWSPVIRTDSRAETEHRDVTVIIATTIARWETESQSLASSPAISGCAFPEQAPSPRTISTTSTETYTAACTRHRGDDIEERQLKPEGQGYRKGKSHTNLWPLPIHSTPTQPGWIGRK